MKQETSILENDDDTARKGSTIDEEICNGDPLFGPLIDTDELDVGVVENERKESFKQESTTCAHVIKRCKGIFYALCGSFIFTCSGFLIKQLRVDFFDALLARFILQSIILTAFILYKKNKFIHGSNKLILLQIIRTMIGSSGLFLFFLSYRYIPLPDLTTCRYTQVVWTAILAMIVFHDRISISTILAIILTLTGVVLVAQPTFLFPNQSSPVNQTKIVVNRTADIDFESDKSYRLLGLCLALACALSISCSMVLNKKLIVSKIPQSIIMLEFSLLTLIILILNHIYNRFIVHKYEKQTMFTWQFFLAASVSLMQVLSSTITQRAIKLEHPAIISVVQSSDILFAIILQNLFSRVKSNWFVILGSFLVTASIFLVGIDKFWKDRKKLPRKHPVDTKL